MRRLGVEMNWGSGLNEEKNRKTELIERKLQDHGHHPRLCDNARVMNGHSRIRKMKGW